MIALTRGGLSYNLDSSAMKAWSGKLARLRWLVIDFSIHD